MKKFVHGFCVFFAESKSEGGAVFLKIVRAPVYFRHLVWSIDRFTLHDVSHSGAGSLVMRGRSG